MAYKLKNQTKKERGDRFYFSNVFQKKFKAFKELGQSHVNVKLNISRYSLRHPRCRCRCEFECRCILVVMWRQVLTWCTQEAHRHPVDSSTSTEHPQGTDVLPVSILGHLRASGCIRGPGYQKKLIFSIFHLKSLNRCLFFTSFCLLNFKILDLQMNHPPSDDHVLLEVQGP